MNNRLVYFKKLFKRILYALIAILVLLNLFILISGRTYLYTGVRWTYFQGKSGPTIYDSTMTDFGVLQPTGEHFFKKGSLISINENHLAELEGYATTSFLVLKNNEIVYENYWDNHKAGTRSNSFSVAKSVVALLVGIAKDQGLIASFDEPVSKYLPEIKGFNGEVTIRHLLMMASGLDWSESESSPFSDNAAAYYGYDLEKYMLSKEFVTVPDNRFAYKSGNTQLLAMLLKKVTGKSLSEYASEYLWSKIGTVAEGHWSKDRKGDTERAYCCLYATTRDFASIGQLILNNGAVNGKQIIHPTTLNELTSISYSREGSRKNWSYGLHFWIVEDPDHPFVYARGIQGQYIIVIPSLNIVIVRTGHERGSQLGGVEDNQHGSIERYMRNHPRDVFLYLDIAKSITK
jgi:CubicO group peptidase (beta-lactamase class C family)